MDCELHKQLVSGCGKRAWRRQELAVMGSCQGPDFQSRVIDTGFKGSCGDEWKSDLSVIFDARYL